jgi:hypothetical protein
MKDNQVKGGIALVKEFVIVLIGMGFWVMTTASATNVYS